MAAFQGTEEEKKEEKTQEEAFPQWVEGELHGSKDLVKNKWVKNGKEYRIGQKEMAEEDSHPEQTVVQK